MNDNSKKAIVFFNHGHVNKGEKTLSQAGREQSKIVAEKLKEYLDTKEMLLPSNYATRGHYIQLLAPLEEGPALETSRILNDVLETGQVTMAYHLNEGKALSFNLGKYSSKAPKDSKCLIFSIYQDGFRDISCFCETQDMREVSNSNAVIFEYEGNLEDFNMYNDGFKGSKPALILKP